MSNARIDDNFKGTSTGITDDASQTIQPLRVNPTTNRLIVNTVSDGLAFPSNPSIFNVPLSLASTEYSQKLPASTVRYKIYAMDWNLRYPHTDTLQYCFTSGESAGTFLAIPAGNYDDISGINSSGTLFFQSATGSAKIVIFSWA